MTTTQAAQIAGGTWTIDTNHSLIEFAARHNEIAYVKGRFRKFSGTINVDEKDLDNYVITGDLTMRGTSKEAQVPVQFNGIVTTRMGAAAGFSGNLVLKLSDFSVPFTREFEPGRRVVGDDLKVELQVEAKP